MKVFHYEKKIKMNIALSMKYTEIQIALYRGLHVVGQVCSSLGVNNNRDLYYLYRRIKIYFGLRFKSCIDLKKARY